MEVILLERIEKLGQMGDVVKVKSGYARNYLLPQKKALRATDANKQHFEVQRPQLEVANLEHRAEAEKVGKKLKRLSVVMVRQAGEAGQLYGSVNARDISTAVTEAGFAITRQQVPAGNVEYIQADLFQWRPAERYDLVFFGFWLSHIPAAVLDDFWTLVAGCLNPGGRVFFVDNMPAPGGTKKSKPNLSQPNWGGERRLDDPQSLPETHAYGVRRLEHAGIEVGLRCHRVAQDREQGV